MIFITGDLHGDYDIHKLSSKCFTVQRELTRSDYVIICGDFGLLWDNSDEEKYWLKWLDEKPWTTLWIDGNHENYDMLSAFPITEISTSLPSVTSSSGKYCSRGLEDSSA